MKLLYDDNMPFGREFFSDLGDCQPFSHQTLTPQQLKDVDVLLVRSTTAVDATLLQYAKRLKYVATATAGTNHLDKGCLNSLAIPFGSAAGCNAVAVAEYVLSVLYAFARQHNWTLRSKSVGIVGAGHVGSALASRLKTLGVTVKLCDPPLQQAGDPRTMVSMEEILQCDVISLHTPLIKEGAHPTLHMFDEHRLSALSDQQLLINACRGEVIDNAAALSLFEKGKTMNLVLDVWEGEPEVNLNLVAHVQLATQHIAGHTLEGKARGTEMLYQQVCQLMDRPAEHALADFLPCPDNALLSVEETDCDQQQIAQLIHQVYDVRVDDAEFKRNVATPGWFAYSRKHYAIRREFSAMTINTGNYPVTEAIYGLGFGRERDL